MDTQKYLTKQQVKTLLDNAPQGVDKTAILKNLVEKRGYTLEGFTPPSSIAIEQGNQKPTYKEAGQETTADLKQVGTDITKSLSERNSNIEANKARNADFNNQPKQPVAPLDLVTKPEDSKRSFSLNPDRADNETNARMGVQNLGQVLGFGADVIGDVIKGGVKALLPQKNEEKLKENLALLYNNPIVKPIVDSHNVQDLAAKYEQWKKNNPNKAADMSAFKGFLDFASNFVGLEGAKAGTVAVKDAGDELATNLVKKVSDIIPPGGGGGGNAIDNFAVQARDAAKKVINPAKPEETALKETLNQDLIDKRTLDIPNEQRGIPEYPEYAKQAKKQGISDKDINFTASLSPADRPVARKMFDLAVEASNNVRAIKRPMDVVGENGINLLKSIQSKNSEAGKLVDQTARALKGSTVDASSIYNKAKDLLGNAGVEVGEDGKFDFSNSIFNKTKSVQNEIKNAFSDLPNGVKDAYDLHKFKKSIDQLVEFGKSSNKGITRSAENILKSVRNATDDVLDKSFNSYNAANSDYKATRETLDQAHRIVGKKVDFLSKGADQTFGQSMRGAFSNAKSRADVLNFIEQLQNTAEKYGVGNDQNLLDQALFAQVLEGTFGSPAVTGLAGEVTKAIKQASRAIDVVRNPIQGGLGLAADTIEHMRNITPEAKKNALRLLLKG